LYKKETEYRGLSYLVDQLDLQILDVIDKAPTIVRSVTEKEIERGMLSPSVTTIDIKRNLPHNISVNIIEGRLKTLEDDGYIYYETNRWWLTLKGKKILGNDYKPLLMPTPSFKPMRTILEETFSKYDSEMLGAKKTKNTLEDIEDIRNRRIKAETLLSELKQGQEIGLISDEEFEKFNEGINQRLNKFETQTETSVQMKRIHLLKVIKDLEDKLAKKKVELEKLDSLSSEK
jgi:hypothetical protein